MACDGIFNFGLSCKCAVTQSISLSVKELQKLVNKLLNAAATETYGLTFY